MKTINETILRKLIIDITDGIWSKDELQEKTGFSDESIQEIWDLIEQIRKENK